MLLRRIMDHVKEQNWTAVGLDFVIVVFGVFIGIQVSNWNTAHDDRETEQVILERLGSDFAKIVETETHYLETAELAAAGSDILLEKTVARTLPDDSASLCQLLNPPRAFRPAPPPSATYEQLVANGDMRLIRNETLRVALAEFESQRNQHIVIADKSLETTLALSRPFWSAVDICDASLRTPDDRFASRIGEIVTSPDFAGAVSGNLTQHRGAVRAHTATKEKAEEVLKLIQDAAAR